MTGAALPDKARLIAVAALLPRDLAKEMTEWHPLIQQCVLTGLARAIDLWESQGRVFDPVRFEAVVTALAYVLHRRVVELLLADA